MKSNIFIPKLCKVGFNERSDTYTGLLGYIIMNDGKKWRKEPSWESWRCQFMPPEEFEANKRESYENQIDNLFERSQKNNGILKEHWIHNVGYVNIQNIQSKDDIRKEVKFEDFHYYAGKTSDNEKVKPFEFKNEALEGFVLNKKAGGGSSGWNSRQTYCRIYDPRGFEFEISIQNLLYILENTNSIKGKGLEGKFIYGWLGKDLILIPESAPEFEEMVKFTKIQDGKVFKKDLIPGNMYLNASMEKLTYMGEAYIIDWRGLPSKKKKLWFMTENGHNRTYSAAQSIKSNLNETNPEFANLMDKLEKEETYYPNEPEYVKVENPLKKLAYLLDKGYPIRKGVFIKVGDGFTKFEVTKRNNRTYFNQEGTVVYTANVGSYGRSNGEFKSLDEIINKYELWELKTMN